MIKDLVTYFLKQGTYSGQGNIAVLCAYLGQLQKVRAALRDAKLAVSVDERDEEQLERKGAEAENGDPGDTFQTVSVAKHVRSHITFNSESHRLGRYDWAPSIHFKAKRPRLL
jgi:hypothetical protein